MLEKILLGGWMMVPLMICNIFALSVLLDRLWAFYRNSRVDTRALRAQMMKLLAEGRVDDAAVLCTGTPGPISAVLLAGLQSFSKIEVKTPESIRMTVSQAMQDASLHSMSAVEKGLWILGTVGNAAPLFGMTGTVLGMIKSFEKLAQKGLDPSAVGIGISEALITTAAGLLIALGAVIPYNVFTSMAGKIELEIEEVSTEMIDFMASGRAGEREG